MLAHQRLGEGNSDHKPTKIKKMTSTALNNKLPQEGSSLAGESLTDLNSVCPMDSGGDKSTYMDMAVDGLAANTTSPNTQNVLDPFKKIARIQRSPTRPRSDSLVNRIATDSSPRRNYFSEWRKEFDKRSQLEKTLNDLQRHIVDLEKKVADLSTAKKDNINYKTDEEELERETNWILAKKKRPAKKRKAESSPEIPTKNNFQILENIPDNNGSLTKTSGIKNKNINPPAPAVVKEKLPPPIIVKGVEKFNVLKSLTQQINSNECKFTSFNNNVWKINTTSSESYRHVTGELNKNVLQWHTYENKTTRSIKVMARGLHPSCDEIEIVEDLRDKGFGITEAKNIIKKVKVTNNSGENAIQKIGLPLFMLSFSNEEKIEKIYSIKSILGIIVKIEPLRKNAYAIIQCKRCQAFGHTKTYCNNNPACVKCAGKHHTKDCSLARDQKAKCVNCREAHPASYRGCVIALEQQKRKNTLLKTQKQKQRDDTKESVRQKAKQPQSKTSNQSGLTDRTKTYSQIVSNARQQEENSVRDMLATILQRLNDQENVIKLLADQVAQKTNSSDLPQAKRRNVQRN